MDKNKSNQEQSKGQGQNQGGERSHKGTFSSDKPKPTLPRNESKPPSGPKK